MFEINSGLGAVVARTSGGREVASSILVAPTIKKSTKKDTALVSFVLTI